MKLLLFCVKGKVIGSHSINGEGSEDDNCNNNFFKLEPNSQFKFNFNAEIKLNFGEQTTVSITFSLS